MDWKKVKQHVASTTVEERTEKREEEKKLSAAEQARANKEADLIGAKDYPKLAAEQQKKAEKANKEFQENYEEIKDYERLEYLNVKEARDKKYALEQELAALDEEARNQGRKAETAAVVSASLNPRKGANTTSYIDSDISERRAALQQEIDNLGRDITLASRIQNKKYLKNTALNAEDFEEYTYDPVIPEEEEEYRIYKQANQEREDSAAKYMSEEQRAIYNYYYNKYGEDSAKKYLESIREDLNEEQAKAMYAGNEDNLLAQYLIGATAKMEQSKSGFQGALRMVMGDDSYQPTGTYDYMDQMAREDLADNGFKLPEWMGGASLGQLGYDLVGTVANMAPSIAVGALTGTGPLAFGASAAGNAYTQKINEGYSKDQATAYGVIIGVSEATLEKVVGAIGFGGKTLASEAVAKLLPKIDNAAARIAVKYGSSMLSEGVEEGLQEVLEPLYRNVAFGESNELEITEDAIYSALLGALSGGLMEGTPYAISEINTAINNKKANNVKPSAEPEPSAEPVEGTEKIASTTFIPKEENSSTVEEDLKNLAKEVVEEKEKEISEKEPTASATNKAGRYVQTISDKGLEEYGSKLPNATKDTGKQVAAMYDPADGISKEAFAKGIDEAYKYGTFNYPIREMDSDSVFAKAIPSEKRHQAYYMGQQNAKAANIENAKIMQKKVLPGVKGKVVTEDGVNLEKLSEHQKAVIELTDMLSKVNEIEHHVKASYELKKDYFYKNKKGETIKIKAGARVWEMDGKIVPAENGWTDPKTHQVWYDTNAGDQGQGIPEQTVSHEYLHNMRVEAPGKYNELVEIVSEVFERNGKSFSEAVAVKLKQYNDHDINIDEDGAQEEVIAQAMSGMFNDPKTLEEFSKVLYKKDKTLWNEIKDWIAEIIERIKEAFKGVEIESEEARMLKAEKDLYERAQKIYVEGIVEAGEKYKNASAQSSTGQVKNADANAKFQARNYDGSQQNQEKERPKISIGMTDSERTKILRYKKIVAPVYEGQADDVINANMDKLESHKKSTIEAAIIKIGEEFGAFIDYNIEDVDVEFTLSKRNLRESLSKKATPAQIAKLLPILKNVVENSIGIERHANRYYYDDATLFFDELLGGFVDGDKFIPVRFGIRHSKSSKPVLYVVVDQEGIEIKKIKAEVFGKVSLPKEGVAVPRSTFKISISQIIHSVKNKDVLRYLPDNMLDLEQRKTKWEGIAETIQDTNDKNDSRYKEFIEKEDVRSIQKMVKAAAKAHGYEIHTFHGTSRGDRVGNVFLPERATSGPMAFFTDDKATAEGYATGKRDTSIAYDPDFDSYETQFRVKVSGMDIPFYRAWGYLPFDARNRVAKKAGQLREDWDGDGELILDPETNEANGGFQWQLKEARGNVIKALIDQWLNSGNLFNEEAKFLDVIEMSGLKEEFAKVGINTIYFKDPNARHEKVYDVYLKINKPFDTATVDEQFISGFIDWYEEQDESKYQHENMESDLWDKNGVDAYEFAERLKRDIENDTTHAWTSIPDSVSDYLKHLGYDGIKDLGGKFHETTHTVWIPFYSNQVKSAEPITYDENDNAIPISKRFDEEKVDIRYQDRLSNADKNRVTILENKIERLEKELKEIESKAVLAGQMSQGKAMAKDLRRKTEAYENAIAKKKEQISAVRQQKNDLLAKAKAERAEAVERVRKADKERMEKTIADIKATERAKFNAAKEKSDEQKRAIIEKYQTSIKKATEGRHKTDIRGKIKRVVNELNTLLTRQTKERHIPLELQKPVAAALDILNLDDPRYYNSRIKNLEEKIENAKTSTERHLLEEERNKILDQRQTFEDKIAGLKKAYEAIRTSTDPYIAVGYNENIAKMIDMVAKDIGDTYLRDMSKAQLEEVYDLYKGILKTVRDANKLFAKEKTANVVESGIEAIKELEKNKTIEKVSESGLNRRKFFWNNLKPVYAFRRMGSETLERLFKNIRKGEDTWAKDVEEAKKFHDKTANKYNFKKWDFNKIFEFTTNTGRKFSLNLGQMMSLYAYSKRDQAYKHLTDGGFVFDDSTTFKKNGKEYYFNAATANNITVAELQKIIGKLSTDQRMFVDEMQKYLSETMGAKGNEVSRAMYDIELFKEGESYFPLKSAKQFLVDRNEVTNATKQLVNSGFTKPIQPGANNPIVLSDFRDVWAAHVNDMSMYHAFVMPIEDFNKVYNVQVGRSEDMDSVSVKSAVQNAFTKAANDYIEQLIKDINGGARTDPREGTYKKFIGNWKKASVFASLSVVIQQPSAIGRAFAEINPVYFMIPTKVSDISHKKQWEQLKKYAPVAFIKEMGYFDTDMSRSTTDYIKGDKTFKDKLDDIAGWAPAKADELTWCAIWDAVKRETKAKHKDLNVNSEEFLKIAGERFTDVIINTQVYDSVLSRSANMRSKGVFMQMLTAFMAEPTTTANMVEQAFREAKAGNPKKAMAYVSSVGASVVLNSVLVSLIYAMRDDDEDERFHEKYLEALNKEIIDGFNPLTYVPLIKDIWSIFQGWKVERVDLALLQDLYDAADKAFKETLDLFEGIQKGDLSEEEIREGLKAIGTDYVLPVVDVIGNMMGVPIKNIRRDVDAFINTYGMVVGKNDLSYSKKYLDDVLHDATLDQLPFGHHFMESKDDRLIDGMRSGDKTYLERLKGTYKTEEAYDNAVKAVIKNNFLDGEISESQAKTYLMNYNGKDLDNADSYLKSWKFEKKYGFNYDSRVDVYTSGQISAETFEKAVMDFKGKTAAEAEAERRTIDFKQAYPDTSLSDDQIKNYYSPIKIVNTDTILKSPYEYGISEETYTKYIELKSECKGVDKDGDGKADSGTLKKPIMKVINKLNLTKEQKDALYFDNGWVKSTLHEAPWR